jgi:hypothetical protein
MATAGKPLSFKYKRKCNSGKRYELIYRYNADGNISAPSIIFLPESIFDVSTKIEVYSSKTGAELRYELRHDEQSLLIYNDGYSGDVYLKALT